jgi:hypothetical protein
VVWFKVDDKLHDHRKARSAGTRAMGLWVFAGSWAADREDDGFVPADLIGRWGTRKDAERLVEVGLWHNDEQDGEIGWRFHNWSEFQPTRAELEQQRAEAAERQRRAREKRKAEKEAEG